MAAGPFPGRIEIVGDDIIDFPAIFAASQGPVRYYVVEHDPRFGDPTFDPFEAAQKGFDYLDCVTFRGHEPASAARRDASRRRPLTLGGSTLDTPTPHRSGRDDLLPTPGGTP
jgi:hypothetical protein